MLQLQIVVLILTLYLISLFQKVLLGRLVLPGRLDQQDQLGLPDLKALLVLPDLPDRLVLLLI